MSVWRAELVKIQESLDRIGDALVTAEKNLDAALNQSEKDRVKFLASAPSRIMRDLVENNERAKKKHGPHANIMVTLGVLSQEMHELQDAVHSREERLIRAELLDVATSALRGVEALDERAEAQRKGTISVPLDRQDA